MVRALETETKTSFGELGCVCKSRVDYLDDLILILMFSALHGVRLLVSFWAHITFLFLAHCTMILRKLPKKQKKNTTDKKNMVRNVCGV